jgi:hypothetical protein
MAVVLANPFWGTLAGSLHVLYHIFKLGGYRECMHSTDSELEQFIFSR